MLVTEATGFYSYTLASLPTAEQYIYVSELSDKYNKANDICDNNGYSYAAVFETEERLHMFSIAMQIEYE